MIKLIATDVDGTLVEDGTCRINPEYFTVIQQLRELGIQVAAASGRQADSLLSLFEPVRDKMFFISNNGGVIGTSSRILFVANMDETLLQRLLEDCKAFPDCYLLLSAAEESYYLEGCPEDFVHLITEEYRFGAEPVKDWKSLPPIVKAAIYHDPALPHPARVLIEPWRGRLTGVVSGREWVDFIGPGVSKGRALRELMESLEVSAEEIMVFGDQMNDLPMMEQAKHSFTVGGAREEVKAAAAHVTAPMQEDGVLQVLKNLVKNKGEFT